MGILAYVVRDRETGGNRVCREYDTIKEAKEHVKRLEAEDISGDTFQPFSYEILGVVEIEGDCEGQAVVWRDLVEIEEGGVVV